MRSVRTSETVEASLFDRHLEIGEIVGRNDAIGIEKHQPATFSPFDAVVSGNRAAFVFLKIIFHIKALGLPFFYDLGAGVAGTVLDDKDFKDLCGLCGETRKQFVDLVHTVVDGHDYGKFRLGTAHDIRDL